MATAAATATASEQGQYLTFYLGGEEYAIGILGVKEILEYPTVTTVPQTPPWIRGVINLRGAVVPVVDLAVKFGLPSSPVTKRTCVVIVETTLEATRAVMGIQVDAVSQVMDLAPEAIQPAPAFGTQVRVDFLQGMATVGPKFVLLLDVDKVLSASELLASAKAADTAAGGGEAEGAS
jgi:purine-binding chemotaxis protein CheW